MDGLNDEMMLFRLFNLTGLSNVDSYESTRESCLHDWLELKPLSELDMIVIAKIIGFAVVF
jgi:hypothetical protein